MSISELKKQIISDLDFASEATLERVHEILNRKAETKILSNLLEKKINLGLADVSNSNYKDISCFLNEARPK
jgi:hypothetical protein